MKYEKFTYLLVLGLLMASCDKDPKVPGGNNTNPAPRSKMSLLNNEWTLKETFEDGVQKTANGTGLYKFQYDGKFMFKNNNQWGQIGTYKFNDKDSNSISVLFEGMSISYWWTIKKLDEKNYNTEFMANGKTLNYNYTR